MASLLLKACNSSIDVLFASEEVTCLFGQWRWTRIALSIGHGLCATQQAEAGAVATGAKQVIGKRWVQIVFTCFVSFVILLPTTLLKSNHLLVHSTRAVTNGRSQEHLPSLPTRGARVLAPHGNAQPSAAYSASAVHTSTDAVLQSPPIALPRTVAVRSLFG